MLYEQEQAMIDPIEDRPELKALQEKFVFNLPDVSPPPRRSPSRTRVKSRT